LECKLDMKKKIFVTGGCGYIGTHVVRELLLSGYEPIVFDNLSSSRLEKWEFTDKVKLVVGDILDINELTSAARDCDAVVHLAAKVSVNESFENFPYYALNNVVGTLNVFKAAIDLGIKKVIYASSAAAVGDMHSNTGNFEPLSPYGVDKFSAEHYARSIFSRSPNIKHYGLRFFNVYGVGQSEDSEYSGVITKFASKIARAEPITIRGDGLQTRDFVSVKKLALFISKLCHNKHPAVTGVINVGSGVTRTIREVADIFQRLSDEKLEIFKSEIPLGEIMHSNLESVPGDNVKLTMNDSEFSAELLEILKHCRVVAV
jgi:UDP-glucose 4-epimerase